MSDPNSADAQPRPEDDPAQMGKDLGWGERSEGDPQAPVPEGMAADDPDIDESRSDSDEPDPRDGITAEGLEAPPVDPSRPDAAGGPSPDLI